MLYKLLFPQLAQRVWKPINLNDFAEITHQFQPEVNFLDAVQMNDWLHQVHEDLGCDYSYGGYLEDRSHLWCGSYIKKDSAIHLGIDFNVPMGTEVYSAHSGKVVDILYDPENFGWGGRVTIQINSNLYVVYAHLNLLTTLLFNKGDELIKGDFIGHTGSPNQNGDWYEHLHIQLLTKFSVDFDGYSKYYDGIENDYPNPELILKGIANDPM